MDTNLSAVLKRLLIKFILSQVVMLVVLVGVSLISTDYYKGKLAEQLSSAFRFSLLSGDSRQIMYDMADSVTKNFVGMRWNPINGSGAFSIPNGKKGFNRVLYSVSSVPICFDEAGNVAAGNLNFYYNRWPLILIAFLAWAVIVAGSWFLIGFERRRIMREYSVALELQAKEAQVVLAAQVAHDIRSPLAALGAAAKGLDIPAEQRKLMEGAVDRMQGIADDLLRRYRAPSAGSAKAKASVYALAGLIEQVLAEKRLQHKEKAGVKIEFNNAAGEIKALVEPKELQRLLSNLVNNSVEAFAGPGTVSVGLSGLDGKVLIEVKDNGKGIPPEILAKLGQKGETHGKTGGTGLGLYHARTTVEGWGGSFMIVSEPGKGTTVRIELPRTGTQAVGRMAVLLDDDMLAHMNWKMAAKAAGIDLKAYKTPEDFDADIATLPKDTPVYIDSDLGSDIRGEDIAKDLHEKGFTDITMATGHGADQFTHLPWLKVTGKEPPWA